MVDANLCRLVKSVYYDIIGEYSNASKDFENYFIDVGVAVQRPTRERTPDEEKFRDLFFDYLAATSDIEIRLENFFKEIGCDRILSSFVVRVTND